MDFWENVGKDILSKGFIGRSFKGLLMEPKLSFWAPYIGADNRSGHFAVNSEHRKIRRDNSEPESDCPELSEERLLEHLCESKLLNIRKLACEANVSAIGSKFDIINRIKTALGKDKGGFNEIFKQQFRFSGGWLTMACKHGVIYTLKFLLRAESPRDYIDVLRSLKFKANIFLRHGAYNCITWKQFPERFLFPK